MPNARPARAVPPPSATPAARVALDGEGLVLVDWTTGWTRALAFGADELVVLSADHVERVDLRDVLDAHRAAGAHVTLVTTEVAAAEASRFAVLRVAEGGRVREVAYKPERPAAEAGRATVATEVFAYDLPHLLRTLERLAAEVGDGADGEGAERGNVAEGGSGLGDFGHRLLPALVAEGRALAVPHAGYWRDLGTIDSYWQGHMDLVGDPPALALDDPAWPIRTAGQLRVPARLSDGARVVDALVSPGARVAGAAERSVLGPGVVVEAGAEVRDRVLLDDVVVRRGARVERAVLDEHAEIGAGADVGDAGDADGVSGAAIAVLGRGVRIAAGERVAVRAQRDAVDGPAAAEDTTGRHGQR